MLEDQPLDLSVRVGDYAELTKEENLLVDQECDRDRKDSMDEYGNAALRLRGLVSTSSVDYSQDREDRTCSEDSDDSCSDNNQKDGIRSRSRPPGTKPYKKNLMRRYREFDDFQFLDIGNYFREVVSWSLFRMLGIKFIGLLISHHGFQFVGLNLKFLGLENSAIWMSSRSQGGSLDPFKFGYFKLT